MRLIYKYVKTTFLMSTEDILDNVFKKRVDAVIQQDFSGFIQSEDQLEGGLSFYFTDNLSSFINDEFYSQSDFVNVGKKSIHYKDAEINILIYLDQPFKVIIELNNNESIKSSSRIFHRGFKNKLERDISVFYYRVFLLFTQIWNIKNHYTYIHAASVSKNNTATIFSGDAGIGKSSLLFRLSRESSFNFISDDLSVINKDAYTAFLGRLVSLKPYHLSYFPFLKDILSNKMTFIQKLQWRILKQRKLLFRVNPHDLFNNYADNIKIKSFIHLSNHSKSCFEIKEISLEQLLSISLAIFNNEFLLAFNRLNNIASLPESHFLSSSEIMHDVKNIYSQVFSKIDKRLVLVPYRSNPNDLYEFLKDNRCLD